MRNLAIAAAAFAVLAGCSYKNHNAPGFGPSGSRFASADYSVLGETSAEACGTYVFGIDFGHLFVDKAGQASVAGGGEGALAILGLPSAALGAILGGGGNPEEQRALYEALDKMPEATHLAARRTHVTTDGLTLGKFGTPIFGKRCATIVAHGVKMGKGPVPNAN
ncbi:MAG: hypothetical protein FJ102_25040 [Deltaproteobacteria bacterium]|nr:hypothetical protein [Deltaproteobacteria bacterium]